MKKISLFFMIIFGFFCQFAMALECPKMPEQVDSNWSAQVDAAVLKIGKVKGAELLTRARTTTTDLLGKLPDSNVVYLEQMMYSSYCSALREDKSISETEKGSLIRTYNKEVRNTINHNSSASTSTSSVQKKSKTSDKNVKGLTGIVISNTTFENNGTAVEFTDVQDAQLSGNTFSNNRKGIVVNEPTNKISSRLK